MAECSSNFDSWLNIKLKALNIDEGIYGSYIKGILEGDETVEDKTEAIEGILSEIANDDLLSHCKEIIENWQEVIQSQMIESNKNTEDVDVKIARLMESQAKSTTVTKIYTEEERKIREAILAQYSQMSDEEETGENEKTGSSQENGLEKNTNSSVVAQAEKEKRDKAKLESQKKKEKDKEDREKQKQQQAERKEKRKTQKGERRR